MSKTEAKRTEAKMFSLQAQMNGLRKAGMQWGDPVLARLQDEMAALYEARWA
jgi:hypothetical protein